MADISQSNWSETDASNNTAAPDGAPEGMAPSGVNDTIRAIMGASKRFWNQINASVVSSGTNAIALGYAVAPSAYAAGQRFCFKALNTITGQATVNVNSLGAKNLVSREGFRLNAGAIRAGKFYEVVYDGTNMVLLSPNAGKVLLWEQIASSSATVDFTGLDASYDTYEVELIDVRPATDSVNMYLRLSESGTFKSGSSDYFWGSQVVTSSSSVPSFDGGTGGAQIIVAQAIGSGTGRGVHGLVVLTRAASSGSGVVNQGTRSHVTILDSTGVARLQVGSGMRNNATPVAQDGVRLLMSAGNISGGIFRLYGVPAG